MEKSTKALQLKEQGMCGSTGASDRVVQISIDCIYIVVHLFVVVNIPFSIAYNRLHQITSR